MMANRSLNRHLFKLLVPYWVKCRDLGTYITGLAFGTVTQISSDTLWRSTISSL